MKITLAEATHRVAKALNELEVECFYSGIRQDVAVAAHVPQQVVHAVMDDLLDYWQSGNGLLRCAVR